MKLFSVYAFCLIYLAIFVPNIIADRFPLSIIHINDFHARYEPTDTSGGTCDSGEVCIGGLARTVYTVKRLQEEHKDDNPIYINAGDSFQGTLWYNVGRWKVTSELLNLLPADAMTLGNHEFDHGVEGVVPFLETINTKMLVANMDSTDEPTMTGKYQASTIIERSDRKIGLIGVILETTYDLANTGDLKFSNESDAIKTEAAKLRAQGANITIAITHCGYDVDKLIAQHAGSEIDVIIGAHSHTFLYTGSPLPGPDRSRGDYPTVIEHEGGHKVLIVQAAAYAKYVGFIKVYFDDNGDVLDWEGAPIYMSSDVPQDEEIIAAMQPWKEIIDVQGNVVVGNTRVELSKSPCSYTECNLGNYFCDAMVHSFANMASYDQEHWSSTAIGLVNTGALRVPLTRGNLTYSHLVTMSPFENNLMAFDLTGDKLIEALEYCVQDIDLENSVTTAKNFLQVSGLKVVYNFSKASGERVVDVKTRCADCEVPSYVDLDKEKTYRIVAPNFLANGGDGFTMFANYKTNTQEEMTDLESLLSYTQIFNPIIAGVEKRITVLYS